MLFVDLAGAELELGDPAGPPPLGPASNPDKGRHRETAQKFCSVSSAPFPCGFCPSMPPPALPAPGQAWGCQRGRVAGPVAVDVAAGLRRGAWGLPGAGVAGLAVDVALEALELPGEGAPLVQGSGAPLLDFLQGSAPICPRRAEKWLQGSSAAHAPGSPLCPRGTRKTRSADRSARCGRVKTRSAKRSAPGGSFRRPGKTDHPRRADHRGGIREQARGRAGEPSPVPRDGA